ncbi:MAG: DEAD/DEAH box helicase [Bacteroidales bacterium]|nr:DEAD/DEAH box helicase [Bacteroidales bacterium]
MMLFTEMGLSSGILEGISELGFVEPTPIQEKVIPILLEEERDIIGLAQTGTGKTAAFGLPLLEKIDLSNFFPQLLILSPTRELCMQITRDLEQFSKYVGKLKITSVYGGASIDQQISALKRGVHIVVATPGRLRDLISRRRIVLTEVRTLVLDEADEMLKMGFREEVDEILKETTSKKHTLLFSATMGPDISQIARNYMHNPLEVTVGKKNAGAENVHHIYHMVQAKDRYMALKRVVDYYPDIYGIVFCRTRQDTKDVASALMKDGYNAEALHGDLTQSQRDYVMQKFRERNLSILVATDVAARGLDVNNLTHVINYNLPEDNENYNHRTGRTGRAGKDGTAVSIINMKEKGRLFQIEKTVRQKFEQKPVPAGREICERQLYHMVNKMSSFEVKHEEIDPYMKRVYKQLEDLSKEEIIKRFVAVEFDRFLDYYKNAADLNIKDKPAERGDNRPAMKKGRSMSRILFNLGKGKGLSKREVIDMVVNLSGQKGIEIGQIEIFKRASTVEVEKKFARQVIREMNQLNYQGIRVEAEENYEFTGNDFRDRSKGPRGQKKKRY